MDSKKVKEAINEFYAELEKGLDIAFETHNCHGIPEINKEQLHQLGALPTWVATKGQLGAMEIPNIAHIILIAAYRLGALAHAQGLYDPIQTTTCMGENQESVDAIKEAIAIDRYDRLLQASLYSFGAGVAGQA